MTTRWQLRCRRARLLPTLAYVLSASGVLQPAAPGSLHAQQPADAPVPPALAAADAPLVVRDVTVIDVRTGRRLPGYTVVIAGTRIRAMGRSGRVRVPRAARVIEARGKYLIPGLWDMHVHPWLYGDYAYWLFLANGVTGVRDAGSVVPLATFQAWKREIVQGIRSSPRLYVAGPSVNEAKPGLAFPHQINVTTSEIAEQRVDSGAARRVVDSLQAAGADFIKPYDVSEEMYFAMAAEARRLGLPFGGHYPQHWMVEQGHRQWNPGQASTPSLLGRLSDSGVRFLDHSEEPDPWLLCGDSAHTRLTAAQCAAVIRRQDLWHVAGTEPFEFPRVRYELGRRFDPVSLHGLDTLYNVWNVTPITRSSRDSFLEGLCAAPDFARPAPTSIADWIALARTRDSGYDAARKKWEGQLAVLYAAGLPILLGTDTPLGIGGTPGFGVHNVLAEFVVQGMTPLAALQTATLNPARALHATDSLGTVAAGKVADLVLLDADPLQDIWSTTKIQAVFANGRYYDRPALDGLLAAAERAANR